MRPAVVDTSALPYSKQGARCLVPLRVRDPAGSRRKFLVSFVMSVSSIQAQGQAVPDGGGNTSLAGLLSVFFDVGKGQIAMTEAGSTRRVLVAPSLLGRGRRQSVQVDTVVQLQDDRDAFAAELSGTHTALVAYLGVTSLNSRHETLNPERGYGGEPFSFVFPFSLTGGNLPINPCRSS